MRSAILLLLFILAVTFAAPQHTGLVIHLENGELCLNSIQCDSKCCHRRNSLTHARCAPKAAESQECSPYHLNGVYYKCTCERGLTCEVGRSIVGSITNSNFGICVDPNDNVQ
ncbi:colipase-like [Microcaecilia unicolor]|uniref:Colipase-like n=1 Tax=Microcaecilia unicolor TaxID=1415580 RepID=A0A6P7ZVM5_9AMPH|nr:colipase-like [Microcaecilia unicolor]